MSDNVPRRVRRRQSAAVYRRRRLMVLILALLILAGIVWLFVAQPWRGLIASPAPSASPTASPTATAEASSSPSPSPSESPEPSPEPTETGPAEPQPCDPAVLEVAAVTDQDVYAPEQNPQLSMELTNAGEVDCTLNVGTSTQVYTITSGSDTWWRSTDCQSEPADMTVTVAAGQTVSSAEPIEWDRTRSSVDTCDSGERQQAPGGGASYHLNVAIGGVEGTTTKQFVLN